MCFSHRWNRLVEVTAGFLAEARHWDALGKRVVLTIDDSDDVHLIGQSLRGTIRATNDTGLLLVHLSSKINYCGRYSAPCLDILVTVPALRWQGTKRLLLTFIAVRVVDACSFATQGFEKTIGTGRLALDK
jgi:hypothetical protein